MSLAAVALAAALAPALAQDLTVTSLELQPATTQPVLAEPLELSVTARFPDGYDLSLDTASQSLGAFDFVGLERKSSESQQGRKTEKWSLTVTPLGLGTTSFPSLDWRLAGPGERTMKSPPVPVTIVPPESVKEHPDIQDLRGPTAPAALWPWLLAAALLAASAAAFWRLWRKARPPEPEGPPLSPEEEAEKRLSELLASGLWERGDTKGFYAGLSDIVRAYLERRHSIPALYMTTYDIGKHLRKAALERGGSNAVREVLESCDLVKFAKFRPTGEERDRDVARARRAFLPPAPAAAAEALTEKGKPA